jgi:hypothetical protein
MVDACMAIMKDKKVPEEAFDDVFLVLKDLEKMREKWEDASRKEAITESSLGKRMDSSYIFESDMSASNQESTKLKTPKNLKAHSLKHSASIRRQRSLPAKKQSEGVRDKRRKPRQTRTKEEKAGDPPIYAEWIGVKKEFLDPLCFFDKSSFFRIQNQSSYETAAKEASLVLEGKRTDIFNYALKTYPFSDLEFKLSWGAGRNIDSEAAEPVEADSIRISRLKTITSTAFQRMKKSKDPEPTSGEKCVKDEQMAAREILRTIRAIKAIDSAGDEESAALTAWNDQNVQLNLMAVRNHLAWGRFDHSTKPDGIGYDKESGRLFPIEIKATTGYKLEVAEAGDGFDEAQRKKEKNSENEAADKKSANKLVYEALDQTYHAMFTLNSNVGFIVLVSGPKGSRTFTIKRLIRPSNAYNDHLIHESTKIYREFVEPAAQTLVVKGLEDFTKLAAVPATATSHYQNESLFADESFFHGLLPKSWKRGQTLSILKSISRRGALLHSYRELCRRAKYQNLPVPANPHEEEIRTINQQILDKVVGGQIDYDARGSGVLPTQRSDASKKSARSGSRGKNLRLQDLMDSPLRKKGSKK